MGMKRYIRAFELTLHEDLIDVPRKWLKPRMVFVNSMSDLFHEDIPFGFIERVFKTMEGCPQHTFQVLTKRSSRLRDLAPGLPWPGNIWIGVTVEDEDNLYRVDDLREVPAHTRFLSCEPLLGPLDRLSLEDIHWVIVGGESGPKARPMMLDWVTPILGLCQRQSVPFFFKQWGGLQKGRNGRSLEGRTYDELPCTSR